MRWLGKKIKNANDCVKFNGVWVKEHTVTLNHQLYFVKGYCRKHR